MCGFPYNRIFIYRKNKELINDIIQVNLENLNANPPPQKTIKKENIVCNSTNRKYSG